MKFCGHIKTGVVTLVLTWTCIAESAQEPARALHKEGVVIHEANCALLRGDEHTPMRIVIDGDEGVTHTFIALPSKRLEEIEQTLLESPDAQFQVTGKVYTYANEQYLLLREALKLSDFSERDHPSFIPIHPDAEELPKDASSDSIDDIVRDLERSTGSLVKSIRGAAENPIEVSDEIKEGRRVHARRCFLRRNDEGAWIAIFVADATGLSDPPCTVLPSEKFKKLTAWASKSPPSTPVLLTGELTNYYGHSFLILDGWRKVHTTDKLPY